MFIQIQTDGSLSLQDHDNMRGFSIRDLCQDGDRTAFESISRPAEENHFWIEVDAVVDLSPAADDSVWLSNFRAMLAGSEQYGYFDPSAGLVKAHIEPVAVQSD